MVCGVAGAAPSDGPPLGTAAATLFPPLDGDEFRAFAEGFEVVGFRAGGDEPAGAALEGALVDLEFALGEEVVLETAVVAGPDAVFAGVDEGALDGEEGALQDPFAVRLDELRLEVVEADRGEGPLAGGGLGVGFFIAAGPLLD